MWSSAPGEQGGWQAAGVDGGLEADSLLVSVANTGANTVSVLESIGYAFLPKVDYRAGDGSYGVAEGLISSFPVTCSNGSYQVVQGLEIDDFSRSRIDVTVNELKEERDAVRQLDLI